MNREAYRGSGVDVAAGERAVELIRDSVEGTFGAHVLTGLGGFAAAVAMPAGMTDPVLISATDGVGTKTAIATELGRLDTIGIDLVAMCADDVACLGARPLFFLDYIALEHLQPELVAELVSGISAGCREASCALVGGETAEHPGLLAADGFDLAGFCVGVVERGELLAEPTARPGDALVGIASSGLHANGYSLVRSLVARSRVDLALPYVDFVRLALGPDGAARAVAAEPGSASASLGDVLLTPTRIYSPHLLALREHLAERKLSVRGYAHITGGGLPGNVPRALPEGTSALVDPRRWPLPSIIAALAALAGTELSEARAVFNGGLGMVAVVEPAAVGRAVAFLRSRGLGAWQVGEVIAQQGAERYLEGPLNWSEP